MYYLTPSPTRKKIQNTFHLRCLLNNCLVLVWNSAPFTVTVLVRRYLMQSKRILPWWECLSFGCWCCKLPDRKVSPSLQLHHICHLLHGWCGSYIYEPWLGTICRTFTLFDGHGGNREVKQRDVRLNIHQDTTPVTNPLIKHPLNVNTKYNTTVLQYRVKHFL